MTITEGHIDKSYIVTDISMEGPVMRRLEALGINSGTKLRLMNRKRNGTVIIKVRGSLLQKSSGTRSPQAPLGGPSFGFCAKPTTVHFLKPPHL